jgi:Tocopherol cyclase
VSFAGASRLCPIVSWQTHAESIAFASRVDARIAAFFGMIIASKAFFFCMAWSCARPEPQLVSLKAACDPGSTHAAQVVESCTRKPTSTPSTGSRWSISARTDDYEAVLEATCDEPGTPLRAPTAKEGLAPFCKDSFFGRVRLRLWERSAAGARGAAPIAELTSCSGGPPCRGISAVPWCPARCNGDTSAP